MNMHLYEVWNAIILLVKPVEVYTVKVTSERDSCKFILVDFLVPVATSYCFIVYNLPILNFS